MSRIVILYEDRLAPGVRPHDYPLHRLIVSRLVDRFALSDADARLRIHPMPKNGVTRVLESLLRETASFAAQGFCAIVAVIDSDRVADHLPGLNRRASNREVETRLVTLSPSGIRVRIAQLEQNLERVLRTAGDCDPSLARDLVDEAIEKGLLARDRVLNHAAKRSRREVRDCIASRVPSFEAAVDVIAEELGLRP